MTKDKQIEEIARTLCDAYDSEHVRCKLDIDFGRCDLDCWHYRYAELIYKEGYRKPIKGHFDLWKPRRINRNATYKCSVCHKPCSSYYNDVGEWKFCPHCGAKMKGE